MRLLACRIIIGTVLLFRCNGALAQHPIDVQYETARGDYLKALVDFDKLPTRIVTRDASIAAAKSAWALGMPERAVHEIDRILQDKNVEQDTRSELILTRGIIELQEGRPQTAALFAERAVASCTENCRYRSKAYLLWGDSLQSLGALGAAESQYEFALETATQDEESELLFRRGMCRFHLGKLKEAQEDLQKIPLGSDRTPQALRTLAEIALSQGDMKAVKVWLTKGLHDYPQDFLDSWVLYARMQAAIGDRDKNEVTTLKREAEAKYPPSDGWITLLQAAAERFTWDRLTGGAK